VAVVRAPWDELGLAAPLQNTLPRDHDDVAAAEVIFGLVTQRCVAPRVDLYAALAPGRAA
jgi:hypothetical protein